MKLSDFDYHLPKELIAQFPASPRGSSKLMVLDKASQTIQHQKFYDLSEFLQAGDVLVFNDSKVFPARLFGQRQPTAGRVEVFLLRELANHNWQCLLRAKQPRFGQKIVFNNQLSAEIISCIDGQTYELSFSLKAENFWQVVLAIGETPLPPYIKVTEANKFATDYQTVYAKNRGSVAAPTAGLHFTEELLNKLQAKGVQLEYLTLHVGLGTFLPVKTQEIEDHKMHAEYVELTAETVKRLNQAKQAGQKIVVVGTTTARALEALACQSGELEAKSDWINIFIYPGYKFKFVESLITNFHLPKSTLLMMVSALAGREYVLRAYAEAIDQQYRFFSFGDAIWIK